MIGNIYAELDITGLLAEQRDVLLALVLLNCGVTFVLAAVGYISVRQMLAPVGMLTEHVERVRDGDVVPIPADRLRDPRTESGRLFARFNAMAQALSEREALAARLAEEEKLAGDLYQAFADRYPAVVFDRIAAAEDQHLTAARALLTRPSRTRTTR